MSTVTPQVWGFAADGIDVEMLYLERDRAEAAAVKAYLDDGVPHFPLSWRPVRGREFLREHELHHGGQPTSYRVFVLPWADAQRDDQCSWHALQIHDVPDSFTGERAEVTCPDECRQLPPGAVCWAFYEPFRHKWPTEPGTYRIRPYHHTVQNGEDGDVEVEFQIDGEPDLEPTP